MTTALHPLMTDFRHSPTQRLVEQCNKRFLVIPAGRRSGKTGLAKRKVVREAMSVTDWPDAKYFVGAPTREQAKRIYWKDLKAMIPKPLMVGEPRESDLVISLYNGAEIHVVGMDKPQRIEGTPWNGGILDEYADMRAEAWEENVRPALAERLAWCWFIGVPEGRNHYYNLYCDAQKPSKAAQWAAFTWTAEEALPMYLGRAQGRKLGLSGADLDAYCAQVAAAELLAAQEDMDPLNYAQEFNASFVVFEGRAYYQFDQAKHASRRLDYRKDADLVFCFDFNRSPGVAVVCQEAGTETHVIGEVHIPRNSTTPAVCRKLVADWGEHEGRVLCYGDATGGAKGSAKVAGSDWDLIEAHLRPTFGNRMSVRVPKANPAERARVNAVNTRLESAAGSVRMFIDPDKAPNVVRDLDSVVTLKGGSGEIDKDEDSTLTHLSDALGYYVQKEFPAGGGAKTRRQQVA